MARKKPAQPPIQPKPSKPGPKPQTVKIEGDWQAAVKTALAKKKPPGGWPKPGGPEK